MARVVFASPAYADSAAILTEIAARAGASAALRFYSRFERLYDRLADFPSSGSHRPALGAEIRIGIVAPFVVIYRYSEADGTVLVLRIVHGRRKMSGALLRHPR